MKVFPSLFLAALVVITFTSCSKTEEGTAVGNVVAPLFNLPTVQSDKVGLNDYKGKVVLLEFFASWCPPCRMVAPEIKSIYKKYKDKGFVVLAVSIDSGPNAAAAVRNFVKEFAISYPVALDDGTASRQYQIISIPTSFLIDKQGKLRSKHIGLLPDFATAISSEIETLL
jgi:thiol-disulfide isomerase/thioredoxin